MKLYKLTALTLTAVLAAISVAGCGQKTKKIEPAHQQSSEIIYDDAEHRQISLRPFPQTIQYSRSNQLSLPIIWRTRAAITYTSMLLSRTTQAQPTLSALSITSTS